MATGKSAAAVTVAAGFVVVLLVPLVVPMVPALYWDVDPRSEAGRATMTVLGPAGAAWLQVVTVLLAAGGVGVAWLNGVPDASARRASPQRRREKWVRRVLWWGSVMLVAVGMVPALWHLLRGTGTAEAMTCGAWVAAAAVGLGVLYLGSIESARRFLVAGLLAGLVPVAIYGQWFLWVERPATVASFLANQTEFLAGRGWAEGSPQHLLYLRRLESPDITGAVGLSNVLGTLVAGLTLLAAGVVVGGGWGYQTLRLPERRLSVGVAGGLVVLGLLTLWGTHSKGAVLALMAGVGVLGLFGVGALSRKRLWAMVPIGLVVLAFVAPVGRAMLGPPGDVGGERSLLFRAYYWQGAGRMVAEEPWPTLLVGTGPAGFGQRYLQTKNPLNPEEVTSAHSMTVDYLVMLGLPGGAWVAVLLYWLWVGGYQTLRPQSGPQRRREQEEGGAVSRAAVGGMALVAVGVFGTQYLVQAAELPARALAFLISGIVFVGVGGVLATPGVLTRRGMALGSLAGATAVLVHSQIEMAFFQPASVALAWALVALAGGAGWEGEGEEIPGASSPKAAPQRRRGWAGLGVAMGLLVLAGVMTAFHAMPMTAEAALQRRAAEALQGGEPVEAVRLLDLSPDPAVLPWRVQLRIERAYAARVGRRDLVVTQLDHASAAAMTAPPSTTRHRLLASIELQRAQLLNDPAALARAAAALERVRTFSPYSLQDTLRLAHLYHDLGRISQRDRAAARGLELDRLLYLDPAKQLTDADRATLREWLDAAGRDAAPAVGSAPYR